MNWIQLCLLPIASLALCDLSSTDYTEMCNQCSSSTTCKVAFELAGGNCSTAENEGFNTTILVLKEQCESGSTVDFTGTADCEVLASIAQGLMIDCGPNPQCGLNQRATVNVNKNTIYCSCDGTCIDDIRDTTLNNLIWALVSLFALQLFVNLVTMTDSVYKFGLITSINSVIPTLGKTV